MKSKKTLIILLILLLFIVGLSACGDRDKEKIEKIEIKNNSFKMVYEIDENLNFDNIFILVTYQNGESEYINVTSGMVIGFDTSTTTGNEDRKLYIDYKGVLSESVSYAVQYSLDNSKEIKVAARFAASKSDKNGLISIALRYYYRGITDLNAAIFTLKANSDMKINADYTNLSFEKPSGWDVQYERAADGKSLKIIFYNKDNASGISDNEDFVINIAGGELNLEYSLVDIEISNISDNAAQKYFLPDIVKF